MAVQDNPDDGHRDAVLSVQRVDNALSLTLVGDWLVSATLPSIQDVSRALAQTPQAATPFASMRPHWVVGTAVW